MSGEAGTEEVGGYLLACIYPFDSVADHVEGHDVGFLIIDIL